MEKGTTLKNCLLLQQQGVISTGFIAYLKHTTTQTKVTYLKYCKKYAYAPAHKSQTQFKGTFKSKDLQFSHFQIRAAKLFNTDTTYNAFSKICLSFYSSWDTLL